MSAVRRTATRLADGRELVYFDDSEPYASGGATRRLDDPRPLADRFAPVPTPDGEVPAVGPEMRLDPLTGEWIPMASERMNRTFLPAADACPLCPARPDAEYADGEVPDTDYDVVVFENRFPALASVPGTDPDAGWLVDGDPLWPARPAAGRCEVVCFSAEHDASLADLPPGRVRTIVEAWADRTRELGALPGIRQVFVFENRGREIGVTLPHPHGQVYALPFVAPRTRMMLERAAAHRARTGRNLFRDVLDAERRAGTRVVAESAHWTAYVPAAARWPVEVHLAPHRDVPDLPALDDDERDDLARELPALLGRLDRFFADDGSVPLPYVAGWHQAVVGPGRELGRLHLQLFSVLRAPGRLKYLAGVESGVAAWVSDTTPECIAARLQELAP